MPSMMRRPPRANTIDRDRFAVSHYQHVVGNNADLTGTRACSAWRTGLPLNCRPAATRSRSSRWTTADFPQDSVSVVDPDPGLYGPVDFDIRNSRLDDYRRIVRGPSEADLGLCADRRRAGRRLDGWRATASIPTARFPTGQPFTKTWKPVSYRAAYTYEPIPQSDVLQHVSRPPMIPRSPPSFPYRPATRCN